MKRFIFKVTGIFCLISAITSCTYSINMIHSEGTATDMIDENQAPSTDLSPTISIPATTL